MLENRVGVWRAAFVTLMIAFLAAMTSAIYGNRTRIDTVIGYGHADPEEQRLERRLDAIERLVHGHGVEIEDLQRETHEHVLPKM